MTPVPKRRWFPLAVVLLAAVSCTECRRSCSGSPAGCSETCEQCKARCNETEGVDPDTCMRTECASICQEEQKQ